MSREPTRRGSLRRRITLAFGLGGLLLAVFLAAVTYGLAERYLLQQREESAERQASRDANIAQDLLAAPGADAPAALESLGLPAPSRVLVHLDDAWITTSVAAEPDQVPDRLREVVEDGSAARQRVELFGGPYLVVGVPFSNGDGEFYEMTSLAELDRTLNVIRNSLVAATAATTLAAALLGLWGSRRLLRPVRTIAAAAERVGEGDLAVRLDPPDDRDLAQVATSFNGMVDALEKRIERDERFAASVSHELRSPLTTLAATADLLDARRASLPPRSVAALDLLVDEVRHFQHLVDDLLELGRSDAGAWSSLEPVAVQELVQDAARRARVPSELVAVDQDVRDLSILADRRRFERVLANLIHNANTHGGGMTALTATRSDGVVRFAVEDRGPGVPEAERGRIFERFVRGSSAARRSPDTGAGLGLALVTEFVRGHHGRVWLEMPENDIGARFVVDVPLHES